MFPFLDQAVKQAGDLGIVLDNQNVHGGFPWDLRRNAASEKPMDFLVRIP
jgi:hypothetical protein